MSDRRLYALTAEDVNILKDALHGPLIGMTFTGGPRVTRIAHAANALTPLDTDDAVERMARALYLEKLGGYSEFTWETEPEDVREMYGQEARAALEALTNQEDK